MIVDAVWTYPPGFSSVSSQRVAPLSRVLRLVSRGSVALASGAVKNDCVRPGKRFRSFRSPGPFGRYRGGTLSVVIVHEDDDILVVSKPAGMLVHPVKTSDRGTLVDTLKDASKAFERFAKVQESDRTRPGIVHRLDRDTSGLLVVALDAQALTRLQAALRSRQVTRRYLCLVLGIIDEDEGTIDVPLGRSARDSARVVVAGRRSRSAVTHFRVLDRLDDLSFLEVRLETGRTHQIRVHFQHIGHPVAGDSQYGRGEAAALRLTRQFLHAYYLEFAHPRTGENMVFTSPLPKDLSDVLAELMARDGQRGES